MDLHHLQVPSFGVHRLGEDRQRLDGPLVLGVLLVIRPGQEDHAGFDEAAEVVNVAVCVLVTWEMVRMKLISQQGKCLDDVGNRNLSHSRHL